MPTFEISTTTYDEDISAIQVALTKIAAICNFEAVVNLHVSGVELVQNVL